MATHFKTLKEYLYPSNGQKTFIIPTYQRGYKWSVRIKEEQTSVEFLMESLIQAYKYDKEQSFFLQGVTVAEDGNNIYIIDGQQRTTTLYLLLFCLDRANIVDEKNIIISYEIRKEPKDFLQNLKDASFKYKEADSENKIQDIYYFKEAIEQIKEYLEKNIVEYSNFTDYLLNKVSLLYIVTDREKAIRTFTMMNGHKATMHDEELIKAKMLHLISLPTTIKGLPSISSLDDTYSIFKEFVANDWETDSLRSKYAREWDKWLYWWNRSDIKKYFNTQRPMGLLLEYYYYRQKGNQEHFSYQNFNKLFPDNSRKSAKVVFKGLRDLQKDFEDVYNNPLSFNYLKCALIGSNGDNEDKFNTILYFINHKRDIEMLKNYSKWRLLGSTHIEVTEEFTNDPTQKDCLKISNKIRREERALKMLHCLSQSHVYGIYNDILFKQLLRLNVEEYNKLNNQKGIKFDFSIWDHKSLEHIYPKSSFYHIENNHETGEKKYIRGDGENITEDMAKKLLLESEVFSNTEKYNEHCIGNLVLLYGKNNSEFGARSFAEKKEMFFNNEICFESRNLLHTISYFAKSKWTPKDIEEASTCILRRLANDYNIQQHEQ